MWELIIDDRSYLDLVFVIRDRISFLESFINHLTPEDDIDPASYFDEIDRLFKILRTFEPMP